MIRALLFLAVLCQLSFAKEDAPYLEQLVQTAEQSFAKEVPDKAAWLANKDRYRRELKEMLGLDPEPPRGDLKPVITGTLTGDGIIVEKLHFQSLPGLYVTANFFRPAASSGKLPTILYVCGHGTELGPDGRSNGNKTHYQHHGVWFAQHGYNALLIDTVQLGEIMGDHHGTYKFNRWWWVSRGYTPAGVETWAGMRALDYLATRPEVDMEKIGVTGRSGGGAYSWFITAVDDRIKVAAPTAGITTLRDHVINGVIEGHCDCMYFVNYYGWDFDKLAALTAPRPLLISNTDKDNIFPLGGVMRIYDSTRRLYKMLDAEKNIGLQISEGPHKDTQPLNAGAFHWFERFFKGADPLAVIKEPAIAMFKKEDLRVFAELPKDEINTKIEETFVPLFTPPPVPETKEEWAKMRDGWMKVLREKVLKLPPETVRGHDWCLIVGGQGPYLRSPGRKTQTGGWVALKAEGEIQVQLSAGGMLEPRPAREVGPSADEDSPPFPHDWIWFQVDEEPEYHGDIPSWAHHGLRRLHLCGVPPDNFRCGEIQFICESIVTEKRKARIHATGITGADALYWSLLGDGISGLNLRDIPASHRQGPYFAGILKYMDMPQAVAMAAERTKVRITGRREDWTWALQTAEKMGFAANLEIVPALEVVEVKKVWDAAGHNAFTSLWNYKGEWFLTFRESSRHVPGTDGAIRVLVSKDGGTWESAALLTETGVDLRDPKFCTAPDGRLMLTIGGSIYDGVSAPDAGRKRTGARTRTAFSTDGRKWTAPLPACDDGLWLWRATLVPGDPGMLYGVAYTTDSNAKFKLSLWKSPGGEKFTRVTGLDPGRNILPNETTLRFNSRGTAFALTRNENKTTGGHTMFGTSEPPYDKWSWTDTGHIIHGPDFVRLKDGRMVYAGRDFAGDMPNTTVGILTSTGQALPMVVLPSGGDCSYPGLAEGPGGQLFVSYYSSHEGKTAIYFARLKPAE